MRENTLYYFDIFVEIIPYGLVLNMLNYHKGKPIIGLKKYHNW